MVQCADCSANYKNKNFDNRLLSSDKNNLIRLIQFIKNVFMKSRFILIIFKNITPKETIEGLYCAVNAMGVKNFVHFTGL